MAELVLCIVVELLLYLPGVLIARWWWGAENPCHEATATLIGCAFWGTVLGAMLGLSRLLG